MNTKNGRMGMAAYVIVERIAIVWNLRAVVYDLKAFVKGLWISLFFFK